MDMVASTKVIDKIKKLLALSNGTTSDNESYVALQKAQALMAEYKLSEKDLSPEDVKKCINRKTSLSYGSRSSDHYMNTLATIIAENFCCVNYLSRTKGTMTYRVCLMGLEDDITIAEEAMNIANTAIIRGYNKVYTDMCKRADVSYMPAKYFNPAKLGYTEGYLNGLKEALASQKDQHQEWGLVLVPPKEATEFMSGLKSVTFNNSTPISDRYYDTGYTDGKNFNMNKKIEDRGSHMLEG